MTLAEKLKLLREEMELSQTQMAVNLGVSLNSVYRWEHGVFAPTKKSLKKYLDLFGVTEEWLFAENPCGHECAVKSGSEQKEEFTCPYEMGTIERHIIKLYKEMPEDYQDKVYRSVKRFYSVFQKEQEK